jgi:hypothetical protein
VARWPWRTNFSCQQADEICFSITEPVIDFIVPTRPVLSSIPGVKETAPAQGELMAPLKRKPHADFSRQGYLLNQKTAASATQCRSNPVSYRSLPKTGIFQISVGDYRRFRAKIVSIGCPGTERQSAKGRNWRAFLGFMNVQSPVAALPGWGGRIRTSIWRIGIGCSRLSERSRRTSFR